MRERRYPLFAVLYLLLTTACHAKPMDSVVSIQEQVGTEWQTVGAGVAVSTQDVQGVLTASHIEGSASGPLRACQPSAPCVPLLDSMHRGSDSRSDWTVFRVQLPPGLRPARIRWRPAGPAESLTHYGFPWGQPWVSVGNVGAVKPGLILGNLNVGPGSSGGPVFDSKGKLLGIVVAYEVRTDAANGMPASTYWRSLIVPVSVLRSDYE